MGVLVLGCGYIGREFGKRLVDAGHDVTGVVRSASSADAVAADGIDPVQADLTDSGVVADLPDADVLVFSASAGRGSVEEARALYIDGLGGVISEFEERASPPSRLLFTSTTGVYGDHGGDWVDESTPIGPERPKAEVIAEAEDIVRKSAFDATIARFAGLYGPGRYRLSSYLDSVTAGWRNAVHRDDAAGALAWFVTEDVAREETVLVSDGSPVDRWEFGDWLADQCGEPTPEKLTVEERLDGLPESASLRVASQKRCRNDRLEALGYDLTYPSVYEGYEAAIDAYRRGEDV
ncbi:NAD(P)H-binding protein [Halolamina salifodinae]|uniref:Nucleoside-diphosphate-sugar epimerase n=1 Tax=Halolamina salifodinae TaxID=1202767 RepID=A0A8T4GRW7_9EURY|nr:NAD(P)H-binding protein [Halolamina salifodinae]MBP1985589.1 nucleoside-diphosphate-sugar epimerase [Halolamina salifodinae]